MIEPERIQAFWIKCGFTSREVTYQGDTWFEWSDADGLFVSRYTLSIDLNNLFLYAMPKVKRWEAGSTSDGKVFVIVCMEDQQFPTEEKADTFEDALFLALEKALET